MIAIESFLTAYDPSDLPGTSIDPLGFERGYLHLADKILPGLTNVASVPRYFAVLCAGAHLAEVDPLLPPRKQYEARRESVLRLERFWALANGFAAQRNDWPLSGLRGVRYVMREVEQLSRRGEKQAGAGFKLLSRQAPYGVLGIYGAVAEGMRFLERETFTLTPDAGERLARAFVEETSMPAAVRKAVREDGAVSIETLAAWGERAYFAPESRGAEEATCLREALHGDPVRSRMATLLARHTRGDDEEELHRLRRISDGCGPATANADLGEAIRAILAYEDCYRVASLVLERLLWLSLSEVVTPDKARTDPVLTSTGTPLRMAVEKLRRAFAEAGSDHLLRDLERLADVRQFLERAAGSAEDIGALTTIVYERHADVQRGKFDRGRRKMPWLEKTTAGLARTATRAGGLQFEATEVADIGPHPYRLASADALVAAGGVSR